MALKNVPLADSAVDAIPDRWLSTFLNEADERVSAFRRERPDVPGFVPSDFVRCQESLLLLHETGLATGRRFMEWGSGLGVAACLADRLGLDAFGIEVEAGLVDAARDLAEDFDLNPTFACGSIVPDGGHEVFERATETEWLIQGAADGYDELGLDATDFDIIYAYPWPGEEDAIDYLFDRYAAVGALLLTYHGINDIRVLRKV